MTTEGIEGALQSEEKVKGTQVRIKQRPEDFSVKESFRFAPVRHGRYRVYLMTKQKLSTFEAAEQIRRRFGLKPGAVAFCGLKDKQGTTEQLVSIDGADVALQEPRLRLKFLGFSDIPVSSENTTSNRFAVTVRALQREDLSQLTAAAAEVSRLGIVNYFDSQRFGSLKHGQGFIAKDLLRGDFETALRNYMAKPSAMDKSEDAKVKAFWRDNWGRWHRRAPFAAGGKYERILGALRKRPGDFVKAFLQIDRSYRALILFTYQSYLWNEGVRRLLQLCLPRESLFPQPYQAGTLLFVRDADRATLEYLRALGFPLLAPDTSIADEKVQLAVDWVLAKEKLSLADLRIKGAGQQLFFRHEERPVLIYPQKLVLGRPLLDELNAGSLKLNVAFTLPPGSYATLVIRRLFPLSYREDEPPREPANRPPLRDGSLVSEPLLERAKRPGSRGKRSPAHRI
ncbi:MAG TPA: tRNA pseudouridine(13) synthase TruD [Myxococcaceae bacterium]|nr:tRNA pseudouridine(13) synthase TruD [Myxococcaceae bacterium]